MPRRQPVPIVDISQATPTPAGAPGPLLETIRVAGENVGFLQVLGHGIPLELISDFEDRIDRFLALPRDEKARFASPTGHPFRGWRQWPDDFGRLELERYFFERFDDIDDARAHGVAEEHLGVYEHPNLWPDAFDPEIQRVFRRYRQEIVRFAERVLTLFEQALAVPAGSLHWDGPDSTSTNVNEYPTWTWPDADDDPDDPKLLLLEHADGNVITLLHQQGDYEGLQVQAADGTWASVPIIPEAILVFFGSSLQKLTNGRWRPGRHRVVAGGSARRRSTGFFYGPPLDTVIAPLPELVGDDGPLYPPSLVFDGKRAQVEDYLQVFGRPDQLDAWRNRTTFVADLVEA